MKQPLLRYQIDKRVVPSQKRRTMEDQKRILDTLTLWEKCRLVSGNQTMATLALPEKGIRALTLSDGPNGVRKEDPNGDSLSGISESFPTTCFPTGIALASSFNLELLQEVGRAMGEECLDNDVNVLLGPAINIQRNPLCGRNFEYLSEDPLLSGAMGASFTKGIQSKGVGACVKHFACNGNEKYRFVGDSIVDDRALNEIYLTSFEIAVKEGKPYAIMTAYNKVNGAFCSENGFLLNDTLRAKWGFDGLVMTDWGGVHDKVEAIRNGLSLEMPGMEIHSMQATYDAVKEGKLDQEKLDSAVLDVLNALKRTEEVQDFECDYKKHYELAVKAATEGAVLLENDGTLPLNSKNHYLVIGDLFATMRYQGSGSSLLNPRILKTHEQAFADMSIDYEFIRGYKESETAVDEKLESEAINSARQYEGTILFFGGQNDYVESEGFDRDSMKLPDNQLSLISKLLELGKKVVFVYFGGSPVELPFRKDVAAILNMNLAGEGEGEATAKLLFGLVSPSGRLTETWPISYDDVPFGDRFTKSPNEAYMESIFVGYRGYLTRGIEVAYPFGYGLSYTKFEYGNPMVKQTGDCIVIQAEIRNTGRVDASEVTQIYVSCPSSHIVRPKHELKGFAKTFLAAGEKKTIEISIPLRYLEAFDLNRHEFVLEGGEYLIAIGSNANTKLQEVRLDIQGEEIHPTKYDELYRAYLDTGEIKMDRYEEVLGRKIPDYVFGKKPYTMETPIGEFKTLFGRIFAKAVCNVGYKQYKKALKLPDGPRKEREKKAGLFIYKMMGNNSLRSMCYSASGAFPYHLAEGMMHLANGRFIKGMKSIFKKEKHDEE